MQILGLLLLKRTLFSNCQLIYIKSIFWFTYLQFVFIIFYMHIFFSVLFLFVMDIFRDLIFRFFFTFIFSQFFFEIPFCLILANSLFYLALDTLATKMRTNPLIMVAINNRTHVTVQQTKMKQHTTYILDGLDSKDFFLNILFQRT